jgi:hypothetical protein
MSPPLIRRDDSMRRQFSGTNVAALAGLVIGIAMLAAPASAQPRWGRARTPRAGACFYRDAGYRGDYFCLEAGESVSSMPRGMNDAISSIQTFGDVEVEVYQDDVYRGRAKRFESSVRNLGDDGWNDRLSSVRVSRRGDGRDRDERRRSVRMTQAAAEDIVRRAYQSVLKRDPDPASRGFLDRVLNDGWSQVDVERELRNSDEYKNRRR